MIRDKDILKHLTGPGLYWFLETQVKFPYSNISKYIVGMRSGCFHNGQWYQQDENWQVGCQYKCTCLNAVKQEYECKDL